jgi:hypothetical protein
MSTLKTTNIAHPSSASNNIVLNSDGTIGGAALAGASDVTGVNTTGTVTSGTTSLTVASATGITAGMYVVGEGITPGTTVSSIVSTTVTLSANANATLSSDPVTFYSASKIVTPAVIGGQLCKAWVNFNGTSTVAIRASYNVSSITDNGVGRFRINMTTALADSNYVVVGSVLNSTTPSTNAISWVVGSDDAGATIGSSTTTSFHIGTFSYPTTAADFQYTQVAVFR